ncbi:MAG: hypothetical protein PHU69_09200 [Fermentimonas sp.]|nr:hypothetical protein [Fermentimonas sp.]
MRRDGFQVGETRCGNRQPCVRGIDSLIVGIRCFSTPYPLPNIDSKSTI